MLSVSDSGCRLHQRRHYTFMGEEAEVIEGVLHNLPQPGVVSPSFASMGIRIASASIRIASPS